MKFFPPYGPVLIGFLCFSITSFGQTINDDFGDGDIITNPIWQGDTTKFIVNSYKQLQLNAPAITDTAILRTSFNITPLNNTEWHFWIKLSFSPSDNNHVKIYLASETENLKSILNGYYIRIGESGSADGIDLFRQEGNVHTKIIDGISGQASKTTNTLRIKVLKDSIGNWEVYADTMGGMLYTKEGEVLDTTFQGSSYFGFYCQYTSSNSTKFFFDDVYAGPVQIDSVPASILSLSVISNTQLNILFTEEVDSASAEKLQNYSVNNGIGEPILALRDVNNPALIHLTFSSTFSNGTRNTLTINNVKDLNGNTTFGATADFLYYFPEPSDLLLNELLFNPYVNGVDFVEVYNQSNKIVDLKELRLANGEFSSGSITTIKTITDTTVLLYSGSYLILSSDPDIVKSQYYTTNPQAFLKLPSMPSYNNDKGMAAITDSAQNVLDAFCYTEAMHYPLLNNVEGVSLERISFNRPTQDSANWHSAAERVGFATPGYENSQHTEGQAINDPISVFPEVFSPDNDGYNDVLTIRYRFNKPGLVMNITLFDAQGRLVRHLVNNELTSVEGSFSWDGISDKREKAHIGIYVIYIETFDLSGEVKKYKKVCVLGGKL